MWPNNMEICTYSTTSMINLKYIYCKVGRFIEKEILMLTDNSLVNVERNEEG